MSGYTHCGCRDCFETVVSRDESQPELCTDCFNAGCERGEHECRAPHSYGGEPTEPTAGQVAMADVYGSSSGED